MANRSAGEPLLDNDGQNDPDYMTVPPKCQPCLNILKAGLRSLLFGGTLALQSWFFYSYSIDYSRFQLDYNIVERSTVIAQKAPVCILQVFSLICLFRLFCGNPGYVTDYFKSEELTSDAAGYQRYALYSKDDFEKRNQRGSRTDLESGDNKQV